jgi:glycosyltransferase involved in cell wall biosynthesis
MTDKILLITSIYPSQIGGPAIFTERFAKWLEQKKYKVKIITYCSSKETMSTQVTQIPLGNNRLRPFIEFIFQIVKNSSKSDLILANGAFIETFLACKLTGRKYVTKIPSDHLWEYSKNKGWTNLSVLDFQYSKLNIIQKIFRFLLNLSFRNAKYVITPSEQLSYFTKFWGVEKSKIKLIYNSADPNVFRNLKMDKKEFDLITVCRLISGKGLQELIRCVLKLDLTLAVIGEGPLYSHLKNLSGNSSKIKFFGKVENQKIVYALNNSKIFVLNSDSEATSYAIIEAKMCGLPVITRFNDGSSILIRNYLDGLIFNNIGQSNLENSISFLIKNKILAKKFGTESEKDAKLRFNQNVNFLKILNLLET